MTGYEVFVVTPNQLSYGLEQRIKPGKNTPLLECNQRMYFFQNLSFSHLIYRQFLSKPLFFCSMCVCVNLSVCELLCSCASAADLSMLRQRKKIGMSGNT